MTQYCSEQKIINSQINNKIKAKDIVTECIQAFKNINKTIFINIEKKDQNEQKVGIDKSNYQSNNEKKELKNIGVRILLYYATPENRIATSNLYDDYFIEEDIPELYLNFIRNHQMFEPLRNATDFRFLEIHGDTSETCISVIKVRVYFNSLESSNNDKTSIDYKFILQRISMPERDLNFDWRVASITII